MTTLKQSTKKLAVLITLVAIMGLTLACTLPFNINQQPMPEEPRPEEPMPGEPHPEEPFMEEEPHLEEPMPEEPQPEEPMPESEGMQPGGEEEVPYTDLAITDIYPGNLPQGNLFVRITNHGPTVLMAAPVELTCEARGHRWASQPGEDNKANTVSLIVQLDPGQTTNENTGIPIDVNLYEYEVQCFFDSPLDNTPYNNNFFEVIPNP